MLLLNWVTSFKLLFIFFVSTILLLKESLNSFEILLKVVVDFLLKSSKRLPISNSPCFASWTSKLNFAISFFSASAIIYTSHYEKSLFISATKASNSSLLPISPPAFSSSSPLPIYGIVIE